MSENNSHVQISKAYLTFMWCTIVVLLIVLLINIFLLTKPPRKTPLPPASGQPANWIDDGKNVPIDVKLRKFLDEGQYQKFIFIDDRARVKIVDSNGEALAPCGGRYSFAGCDLDNIDLIRWNTLSIFEFTHSPGDTCVQTGPWGFC